MGACISAGFGVGFGLGVISDRLVTVDASTPTDTGVHKTYVR
jgi:hypothetical protein